jgi:hypothetical protein
MPGFIPPRLREGVAAERNPAAEEALREERLRTAFLEKVRTKGPFHPCGLKPALSYFDNVGGVSTPPPYVPWWRSTICSRACRYPLLSMFIYRRKVLWSSVLSLITPWRGVSGF